MKKDLNECGFMTRNEVKKYLGISENTFKKHYAISLPCYKVGSRLKYKREEVDQMVERIWSERKEKHYIKTTKGTTWGIKKECRPYRDKHSWNDNDGYWFLSFS